MLVNDDVVKLSAIEWGAAEKLVTVKQPDVALDVAFAPQINEWQGTRSVQLMLKDWDVHPENRI